MSQRLLLIIVSIGVVTAVGLSALVSWGVTSSMIASATIAGPAGAAGRDGATGPQGPPGVDGKDGADGAPGTSAAGTPGAQGATGATGADGADGQDAATYPPVTSSSGPGFALFSNIGPATIATLTVPAGTYALTASMTDLIGFPDFGLSADVRCDAVTPTGTIVLTATFHADRTTTALAASGVVSFTTATVVTLQCTPTAPIGFVSANWADAAMAAIRLA